MPVQRVIPALIPLGVRAALSLTVAPPLDDEPDEAAAAADEDDEVVDATALVTADAYPTRDEAAGARMMLSLAALSADDVVTETCG